MIYGLSFVVFSCEKSCQSNSELRFIIFFQKYRDYFLSFLVVKSPVRVILNWDLYIFFFFRNIDYFLSLALKIPV